ncbi:hypothetical protein HZC20_01475 [Candidatus Peregrinibacteria bacterium]|nr:hypothetical protein [Candidatus Peregrinibacteria bacterium]
MKKLKVVSVACILAAGFILVGCSQKTEPVATPNTDTVKTESSKKLDVPKFDSMDAYVDFALNNPSAKDFVRTSVPAGFNYIPVGGDKTQKMNYGVGKTNKVVALYSDYALFAPGSSGSGNMSDPINFYLEIEGNFYGPFIGTLAMTE